MNNINNSDNYICRTVTENPGYMQVKFIVPEDIEIVAGEIFVPKTLDIDLGYGNWDVYTPENVENAMDIPAIILNGGFETLADGRRPDGNADYTQYIYREGEVISSILLLEGIKLELSPDNISNYEEFEAALSDNVVNTYLYPEIGTSSLKWTKNLEDIDTKVYLLIEATKYFRLGGLFGSGFANTLIVRVKNTDLVPPPAPDPEITDITADIVPNLQVGNSNVNTGATVATLTAVGGTSPYVYSLEESSSVGADNASFVISENKLNIGAAPLSEAKTYKVNVKVTDTKNKSYTKGLDISVVAADPEITAVNINVTPELASPLAGDTVVATIEAEGGTSPFTYELVEGSGDNSLFSITGNEVKNNAEISEGGNKSITVKATDSKGKTMQNTAEIAIS